MRRLSALVLCLGLVFFGSPARAQYADENISYFTGAWTCGVEKLVFRPGDYQLLIAEFSLGDTVSATASFGIPTVRLLAPPVFDPDARNDAPVPAPTPARRRPYYYQGFLGNGVSARLASFGPDSAGVWTWTQADEKYMPTDAVMTWTVRSKNAFDRSFGKRQAGGTVMITGSDTCLRHGDAQRVRQASGHIDFSQLRFPRLEIPAANASCLGGFYGAPVYQFYFHGLSFSQGPRRGSFIITDGQAPPGVVAAIGIFIYDGNPPQYFTSGKSFAVGIPDESPGAHRYWVGTLYLYPDGDLEQVHVEQWCLQVPNP